LEKNKTFKDPIVTEIVTATEFYAAEIIISSITRKTQSITNITGACVVVTNVSRCYGATLLVIDDG
jgi:peptide methionine sulfoxide reductase MsrA